MVEAMGHIMSLDANASPAHFLQMNGLLRAVVLNVVDVAWQHKAGLLDRRTLDNTAAPLRFLFAFQGLRALWQMNRPSFSSEAADTFEKLIIEGVPVQIGGMNPITVWRAIAEQLAADHSAPKAGLQASP
jgi:hypothetical protein